ncbi:hypothetical protein AQUCO_04300005v1 [Aquilegia coerulea]|uniref:DYW domain-containing protein n=1 Tax=Aquilegia coerulea TaxID=218851 RepID=A0A2G5CNA4_AQUCA|nr:hypothetical protein AQUCO_10000038v1 [Aquilegia coerulea]PIA32766.1 hypothetical protein AQUCO_04300005v1 [Aquilegia coerulea]PIA32767.1 hypothetical protein AQUCO_04300005v1 [Aquilegia coerulea]
MNKVYKLHAQLIKIGHCHNTFSVRELLLSCIATLPESLLYLQSVFYRIRVPDTFAWNTIIRAYSHISPQEAFTLFLKMRKEGVSPDNFTFPFVLKASASIQSGRELHSLVLKLGFHSDIFVQNSLIHMYGSCELVDNSIKVFSEMDEKDLVSWSSAIACLVDNGFNNEALELFREMQLYTSIRPDEVTMVSVISAVSSLGCLELGKWVHLFIYRNELRLTISVGTALINMYSRCGSIDEAIRVFDEMPRRNIITWTALINGLAVHGRSREALNVFYGMRESGLRPDYTTFIGVLVACSHGGLVEEGWNVFRSIKNEYGMEPGLEHYGSMVDLLGRAGLLGQAYEFIAKMPIGANSVVWRTLLGACVNHGNLDLAKQVKEKLSMIDPYHDGDYVLLSNVYGGVNRWNDKAEVRSSMRNQRIEKKPGCSLIEVNWVIHEFVSGDNSHPEYETVRNKLSSVIQTLRQAGYAPDTNIVLFDVDEEEKEKNLSYHSEKLAVAFSLLVDNDKSTIRVMKNLRICTDCHQFMKYVSKVFHKEIIIRDRSRFHHFIQGSCSCRDYW